MEAAGYSKRWKPACQIWKSLPGYPKGKNMRRLDGIRYSVFLGGKVRSRQVRGQRAAVPQCKNIAGRWFLSAIRKILNSSCLSICPSVWKNSVANGRFFLLNFVLGVLHYIPSRCRENSTLIITQWHSTQFSMLLFNGETLLDIINHLKTELRPLYLKTQSVPRCKHFSPRL
jgi:hypothetical protein